MVVKLQSVSEWRQKVWQEGLSCFSKPGVEIHFFPFYFGTNVSTTVKLQRKYSEKKVDLRN